MANLEDRYAEYFGEDNLIAQQLMNQYNNESALAQQGFQQYMSDTAHQREVADLLKAGLNPQLSANAGAPAMTGSYAAIDSSPVTAASQKKLQTELQKNDLANQRKMQAADFENSRYMQNIENKTQMKMQENALKNEQIINKYSADKSYALGVYQAQVGAAATRYAASQSANAARYGAAVSAAATRSAAASSASAAKYGYDLNYKNNEKQRAWDTMHPNNPYQAAGSVLSWLSSPSNSGKKISYTTGGSSAK